MLISHHLLTRAFSAVGVTMFFALIAHVYFIQLRLLVQPQSGFKPEMIKFMYVADALFISAFGYGVLTGGSKAPARNEKKHH